MQYIDSIPALNEISFQSADFGRVTLKGLSRSGESLKNEAIAATKAANHFAVRHTDVTISNISVLSMTPDTRPALMPHAYIGTLVAV